MPIKNRIIIILSAVSLLMVLLALLLNNVSMEIRLKEVVIYLQQLNKSDYSDDHIHLISRYSLHQKMYRNQISSDEAEKVELRLEEILTSKNDYSRIFFSKVLLCPFFLELKSLDNLARDFPSAVRL